MTATKPLLSLCIPTFNRAETLRKSLTSFVSEEAFLNSNEVEIVIADNCSSDHTPEVVRSFMDSHPGRIRYSRNATNILDKNLERVLRMGQGSFRKLQTDAFGVRPGLLGPWIRILKSLQGQRPVVFLVNEVPKSDEEVIRNFHDLDEFLGAVSFNCTWGGGFGIWDEDLESMPDFSRDSDLRLVQTDVLLRMMAAKRHAVVVREFIQPCFGSGRKSGYNIAEVFGANYLSILRRHVADGSLSSSAYAVEKKRVLIDHILPFVVNPDHDFEHDNLLHHLRDYLEEPYFRPALESVLGSLSARSEAQPSQLPRPTPGIPEAFGQQWRRVNAHNETTCDHPIPLSKVSVGRRTYGAINAWHWGHADEGLHIGHFCSIGAGVEFILGGNHAMDCFSTFPWKVKYLGQEREALTKGSIVVGDDVWIGNRATILSGSQIGQGAVIGACAVVSGVVPPYAVMAGNPARVVRFRFPPGVITELLKVNYGDLRDEDIYRLADRLYAPITEANVQAFVAELTSGSQLTGSLIPQPPLAQPCCPAASDY
jgi:acetyltransferase-like isoleucine patch superfamily enzyme